jgi:hypothetical protein
MNCVGHQSQSIGTHPRDGAQRRLSSDRRDSGALLTWSVPTFAQERSQKKTSFCL